jgi:hypothetical protein
LFDDTAYTWEKLSAGIQIHPPPWSSVNNCTTVKTSRWSA